MQTPRGKKYTITLTDYFSKWAEAAALPGVELFSMPYNHQEEDGYRFLEIKVPACTNENRSKRLWCSSFAYHAAKGDDLSKMLAIRPEGMREHLVQCFRNKHFEPFPLLLLKHPTDKGSFHTLK